MKFGGQEKRAPKDDVEKEKDKWGDKQDAKEAEEGQGAVEEQTYMAELHGGPVVHIQG